MTAFGRPWLLVALLWVLASFAYLPSFDVPFTFDDIPNIVSNDKVQPDSFVGLTASLDARGGDDRPVAMVSFALNYLVGGLDVFGYHLANLAIHLVNVALLFVIIRVACRAMHQCGRPVPEEQAVAYLAFFAAAVWALHPVNTQAVVYIVQRMTSLATMFYLAAILAFAAWRAGQLRGSLATAIIFGCFALGMGAKPIVVTMPAALWLMDVVLFGRWRRLHTIALGGMIVGVIALTVVYVGLRPSDFLTSLPKRDFTAWERLLTEGRVLWHYLGLYIWPLPERLHLDYAWSHSTGWLVPPTTVLSWVALFGVSILAFRYAARWPWPAFGWLFFVVASSIEASYLNLELVFEHRIYLPSAFLAAGVLAVRPEMLTGRHAVTSRMLLLIIVGLLAAATVERNRQWADFGGFWASEIERQASLGRAAINAAGRYNRTGHPERALAVLQRARPHVSGRERYQVALHQADALFRLGRYQEAERIYRQEMMQSSRVPTRLVYGLGQALLAQSKIDEAEEVVHSANQAVRNSLFVTALDASVKRARGRPGEAAAMLESFLAEHPGLPPHEEAVARFHIANAFHALSRPEEAYRQYHLIVERNPEHWGAWSKIHQMLKAGGDHAQAQRVADYLEARGVDPSGLAVGPPGARPSP